MIYSLIFLFFVPFVFFYEYNIDHKIKLIFTILVLLILVILTGLRGSVDGDYENYFDIYNKVTKYYNYYSNIVEPGYIYINKFAYSIHLGFNFVLFIMAILTIMPKVNFFFIHSKNFPLTLIIFYSTIFFIFDFTQIRQAFAIGIFMCSLKYIINKNILMYLIFIIFASLFHYSALILLPGYFLFNKNYNNNLLYFLVAVCTIISVLQIKINLFDIFFENVQLADNVYGKLNYYQQSEIYSFISIKQVLFGFIFIFLKKSDFIQNKYLNILINLYIFGIVLTTALNQVSEVAYRIKWYFFWTECILVVSLVSHFSKNIRPFKFALNLIFIIYYFIIFIILLDNLSNNGQFIYPYKLFFEF